MSKPPEPAARIVIDTDPGVDDAVALALAARSPEIDVLAVTTTYGTAPLGATTRNAREVLRRCGRTDIPVHPGCDHPLERRLQPAPETHGESGMGYAPVPDPGPADATANPGVLLDVLSHLDQPVTLVTIGPLTNLASALGLDEALVRSRVRTHLGMFGALSERGSPSRTADFNTWCDPEAADRVLRAGLNTLMVGLDVTRKMTLDAEEIESAATSDDPLVSWLGCALSFYVGAQQRMGNVRGCVVHDPLTVGEILAPGLLTCSQFHLTVDLGEGEDRGRTRVDAGGSPITVAVEVDMTRMRCLLKRVLG